VFLPVKSKEEYLELNKHRCLDYWIYKHRFAAR
jgi:hypothetical protein